MSAFETIEQTLSAAAKRFAHWDSVSRARSLEDWESRELERAFRQMQRDEGRLVRAQAAPPPARKRRSKGAR